mmetsp:Transcript_38719/g.54030  ORF Transcript_38719/g.54030 Transcript_38719/m.54030 type:complete len:603 (+) Transcript_38719:17-1825(+)
MSPQAEALIALLQRRVVWQATGAVMVAWFFGYYAFGFWWSLWLVPLFYTWERIHSRRYVRQQVQKYADLVQERDEPEVETVEWINRMMLIAWPTMGPYISNIIMEKSADALEANKPMMVSRMCLEGVTMGMVPPILSDVIVYKSDANILDIECTINLDSQIAMEMAAYTKPARVPVLVKEPQFKARSRVTAWLIPREPFLSQMRVSFLERPDIDVTVKPISVGPDVINLVPGLSGAIKDMFIGMFSDQWIHPKYLEIVLEQPEGEAREAPVVAEKAKKKGMIGSSVGAIGGVGSAGAGLVGSGVGAVGAGVGKVGAVGANTTKAVGGAAAGGAKAVTGAAAAGIGSVGKLGSSGVTAISGGIGKVNPFSKKKSVDGEKGADSKDKDAKESSKKESSSTFSSISGGLGFGKKEKKDKKKKKVEADSESAREVSATEDTSEESHAHVKKETSKKSLFGFGRTKSSKKVDEEASESNETTETSEERKHHRKHKKEDGERKHKKKHRKHRDHGDDEDASETSEASEGGDEDRTERSERRRKTRKHKHKHKKEHSGEEKEKEEEEEDDHHSISESVSHMTESLSSLNPFGKKDKKKKDKKKDKSSKE